VAFKVSDPPPYHSELRNHALSTVGKLILVPLVGDALSVDAPVPDVLPVVAVLAAVVVAATVPAVAVALPAAVVLAVEGLAGERRTKRE
jgi:hypothetical protein